MWFNVIVSDIHERGFIALQFRMIRRTSLTVDIESWRTLQTYEQTSMNWNFDANQSSLSIWCNCEWKIRGVVTCQGIFSSLVHVPLPILVNARRQKRQQTMIFTDHSKWRFHFRDEMAVLFIELVSLSREQESSISIKVFCAQPWPWCDIRYLVSSAIVMMRNDSERNDSKLWRFVTFLNDWVYCMDNSCFHHHSFPCAFFSKQERGMDFRHPGIVCWPPLCTHRNVRLARQWSRTQGHITKDCTHAALDSQGFKTCTCWMQLLFFVTATFSW